MTQFKRAGGSPPWSWKLNHLTWSFDVHAIEWSANKRYEARRNVRAVLAAVGEAHLVTWLENRGNADYLRPTGVAGLLSETGRPARIVYRNLESPCDNAASPRLGGSRDLQARFK
jgi:hypothetical protein